MGAYLGGRSFPKGWRPINSLLLLWPPLLAIVKGNRFDSNGDYGNSLRVWGSTLNVFVTVGHHTVIK